jgi:hypothetical protein
LVNGVLPVIERRSACPNMERRGAELAGYAAMHAHDTTTPQTVSCTAHTVTPARGVS